MTARPPPESTLTGPRLGAFLDEAHALIEEGGADESDETRESATEARLSALLAGQDVRPDRPEGLSRLAWLWVRAGQPGRAVEALDRHQAAVLEGLPAAERLEAAGDLAFSKLNALRQQWQQTDPPADASTRLRAAVAEAAGLLSVYPVERQGTNAWQHLNYLATSLGDHSLARQCADARHKVVIADPDRAAYLAWDDAQLAVRLAHSWATEGDAGKAEEFARQSIARLSGAAAGQDVDHDDWLNLGDNLLPLAADQVGLIVQYARASLGASASPALRRDLEVRAARLQARALHAQGKVEEALVQARQGRYALTSDRDDSFSVLLLDWLLAAGQQAEAAQLAFECVWNTRPASGLHACKLAMQQADSPPETGVVDDNYLGRRIDSSVLLPALTRCLT